MADKWDQYGTPVAPAAAPDKWDKYGTPVEPPLAATDATSNDEERGFLPRLKENATNLVINAIRDPMSLVRGAAQFLPSAPMGGTFGPGMAGMGGIPIDPSLSAQSNRWDVSLPSERAADMVIPLGAAALATLGGTPAGRAVMKGAAAGTGDIIGNTARFGVGALKGVPEAWTSIRGIHLMKPGTFIDPLIQLGKAGAEEVQDYRAARAADAAFRASQPPAPEWMNNPPKGTPTPPPRAPAEPPPAEPPVSTKRVGGFGSTGVARKPMGPPKVTYNPEELPTIIDPDPLRPVPPEAPPEPGMPTKRVGGFGETGRGGKKPTGPAKVTYSPEDLPVIVDPETLHPVPSSAPVDEFAGAEREPAGPHPVSKPPVYGSPEWLEQYKQEHPDMPLPTGFAEPPGAAAAVSLAEQGRAKVAAGQTPTPEEFQAMADDVVAQRKAAAGKKGTAAPTPAPAPAPVPEPAATRLAPQAPLLHAKEPTAGAPTTAGPVPFPSRAPGMPAPPEIPPEGTTPPTPPPAPEPVTGKGGVTIPEEELAGLTDTYREMAGKYGSILARKAMEKDTRFAQYLLDNKHTPETWEALSEAEKNKAYKASQPGKKVNPLGSAGSRPIEKTTAHISQRMRELSAANPMQNPPVAGAAYPQPANAPGAPVNGVAPQFAARAPGMPPPPEMPVVPPTEEELANMAPRGRRAEVKPAAPPEDPNAADYARMQDELNDLDSRAHQMTKQEWEDQVSFESPNARMKYGSETKRPLTQQEANMLNRRLFGAGVTLKNNPLVKAGDLPTQKQVEALNGSFKGNVRQQRGMWQDVRGQEHRQLVQDALNRGETVPAKVLADYPELAAKEMKSQALRQAEEPVEAHPLDKSANEVYGAPYNELKSAQQVSLKNFKTKTGNAPTIDDVKSGAFKRR